MNFIRIFKNSLELILTVLKNQREKSVYLLPVSTVEWYQLAKDKAARGEPVCLKSVCGSGEFINNPLLGGLVEEILKHKGNSLVVYVDNKISGSEINDLVSFKKELEEKGCPGKLQIFKSPRSFNSHYSILNSSKEIFTEKKHKREDPLEERIGKVLTNVSSDSISYLCGVFDELEKHGQLIA